MSSVTRQKRGWTVLAINVRTNHVHVVVAIGSKRSKDVLIALKANATRQLREDGLWPHEHTPWADKGSRRNLWNEKSIWEACNYVINEQGDKLPDFDWCERNPVATAPGSDLKDLDGTNTDGGELTHSYSVESDGEVRMIKQEIIYMITKAGFDPVERDTVYNRVAAV